MSGAWGCPHDLDGVCQRVRGALCSPGMRGCELEGKVRFADPALNAARKPVKAPEPEPAQEAQREAQSARPRRRLPF